MKLTQPQYVFLMNCMMNKQFWNDILTRKLRVTISIVTINMIYDKEERKQLNYIAGQYRRYRKSPYYKKPSLWE